MSGPEEEEWTPEKEAEGDPARFQKEYLKHLANLMRHLEEEAKAKEKEKEKEKAEDDLKEQIAAPPRVMDVAMAYQPPLLSAVLDRWQAAWKEIGARFEDKDVRVEVFRALLHQPWRVRDDEQDGQALI